MAAGTARRTGERPVAVYVAVRPRLFRRTPDDARLAAYPRKGIWCGEGKIV